MDSFDLCQIISFFHAIDLNVFFSPVIVWVESVYLANEGDTVNVAIHKDGWLAGAFTVGKFHLRYLKYQINNKSNISKYQVKGGIKL